MDRFLLLPPLTPTAKHSPIERPTFNAASHCSIAVGVSGQGSNLRALVAAERRGVLGGSIVTVFADRTCPAVDWAIAHRVNAGENDVVIMPSTFGLGLDPSVRKRDRNPTLFGTGKWNRVLIDATMNLNYDPDPDFGGARYPPTVRPSKEDEAAVQVFPLRGGKMIDRYSFHLENVAGQDLSSLLEAFCVEYYGTTPRIPPQIVVPRDAGDLSALAEWLSERRGARVELRASERGEKRRLQELASENARVALSSEAWSREQRRLRRVEALEELREGLNLESLPLRIECFDISTIQGEGTVGSLVVFEDAVAKKAHYRKFAVRGLDGQDDFASMGQVVSRRFARLGSVTDEDYDESFAQPPNLVVVDGGKGQLSAALAAMHEFDLPRVAVIALAKREEEVFVPGRPDPIRLDPHSAGHQLLRRIRDEAHRFALGYHRQRRSATSFESLLDELEGVGPARRRALLRHFGSAEGVLAATQEELEGAPGVPPKTARAIYAQLHKAGRP